MNYVEAMDVMNRHRGEIAAIRGEMRKIQQSIEPVAVQDYALAAASGATRLSALFGSKDDLIVIHNMGRSCAYCTLWADGFNGVYPHLASRAAFVITTPDAAEVQQEFAAGRGWRFPMASHRGSSFATDMGYGSAAEGWRPGLSVFRRDGGRILRVADTAMGPHDDFCSVWHFFDLLPAGAEGWRPKFHYA